jgi:transposase
MKLHRNAALSWRGRRELACRVVVDGWTLMAAAEAAGVSVRCARKWVGRYRLEGDQGLDDRSSAPRRVANRTPADRVAVIVALRQLRMTAAEIAETLRMPLSTVSAVLCRSGLRVSWSSRTSSANTASPCPRKADPSRMCSAPMELYFSLSVSSWARTTQPAIPPCACLVLSSCADDRSSTA